MVQNVISLISGLALFLFGMLLMGDGLKKVAGSRLELILYRLSGTPVKGIMLGAGVTAVIQSSSATSVMVVGFVNSGMIKMRQAISIILGAVLGTSVTGWIIALSSAQTAGNTVLSLFSTASLTGLFAAIGIAFRMASKSAQRRRVGDIFLGFAVLMTGMVQMSDSVMFLRENEAFLRLLTDFSNPVLGILAGILITSVLQSASAAIGIVQAMSATGAITFAVAFPLCMGISIGAAVPVLLSALGARGDGKRCALSYLLINAIGSVLVGTVFYLLDAVFSFSFMPQTVGMTAIALMNTAFRLAMVLLLSPLIPLLEKITRVLVRTAASEQEESADLDRLEERFLLHPVIAVEQAFGASCAMARKAEENLSRALGLLRVYDEKAYDAVREKEEVIDRYEDRLATYLMKLTGKEMPPAQSREVTKLLHTISDFERIGDHAVNFSDSAREISQKKIVFPAETRAELGVLQSAVLQITALAMQTFTARDASLARRIEPLEQVIDDLCDDMKIRHVRRMQKGDSTLEQGFVFNDLLTNYERVADHCSNIAVAMIELENNSFDTHRFLDALKADRDAAFTEYYEDYNRRYRLPDSAAQEDHHAH